MSFFEPLFFSFWCEQGEKKVLFDVTKDGARIAPKYVPPEEEREPNESRRCVSSSLLIIILHKHSQ